MRNMMIGTSAVLGLLLVAGGAIAEQKPSSTPPWQRDQAAYGSVHPMQAKCSDMVKATPAEQTHLVAWLEGMRHGREGKMDPNTYQPVSVTSVQDYCVQQPGAALSEAIGKITPHR